MTIVAQTLGVARGQEKECEAPTILMKKLTEPEEVPFFCSANCVFGHSFGSITCKKFLDEQHMTVRNPRQHEETDHAIRHVGSGLNRLAVRVHGTRTRMSLECCTPVERALRT